MRHRSAALETLESRQLLAIDLAADVNTGESLAGKNLPIVGSVTFFNEGTTATGAPVPYRLTLVSRNVYDPAHTIAVLANGTAPAVAAGGQQSIDFSFPVQDAWLGKMYFLHLTIDPNNAIAQATENESENDNYGAQVRIAAPFVGSTITGTSGDDSIHFRQHRGFLFIGDDRYGGGGNEQDGYTSGFKSVALDDVSGMTIDLLAGQDVFYSAPDITMPVTVLGGDGYDKLTLGGGADSVSAGSGNDSVLANGGNDYVAGDSGRDTIRGGAGNDYLKGNAGGDYLVGGDGDDVVVGNGGNDRLLGSEGIDRLLGGAGDDRFVGGRAIDTIVGHEGTDTAQGGVDDILYSIEVRTA